MVYFFYEHGMKKYFEHTGCKDNLLEVIWEVKHYASMLTLSSIDHKNISWIFFHASSHEVAIALDSFEGRVTLAPPTCSLLLGGSLDFP